MLMIFIVMTSVVMAQEGNAEQSNVHREWWNERFTGFPSNKNQTVRVEGNRLVNSLGDTILFKGIVYCGSDKKFSVTGTGTRLSS